MGKIDDEDRILRLAVTRGWLDEGHITRFDQDPERETISADDRSHDRVEQLVRCGLLDPEQVEALSREAGLDEGSTDDDASPDPILAHAPSDARELDPELAKWDRYRVDRLLGRGGSGAVYLAHDPRLDRLVAIKILSGSGERSLREARAQARVEHENICKVYEVGWLGSRPFIVMQHVAGETLREAAPHLTREQIVTTLRDVAGAVQAAHTIGLIHRDLKPENLMIERSPEGGMKPYVMDFGLAKELLMEGSTVTGSILGTPAYMAPEQASGQIRGLDRRTDVYALGATLYDALSGAPPFRGPTAALLLQIVHDKPIPLRSADPSIAVDLETIVMKCLEKDPSRRYASARALAEDLDRYLRGVPIQARRAGLAYRLARWARRRWAFSTLAAAALVAVGALSIGWVRESARARDQAELGRRFGEDIKEIEGLMRLSLLSPLHDTRPDRARLRARMETITQTIAARGEAAGTTGHHALGRGFLALRQDAEARVHLEEAWRRGDRSPALAFALAQAFGALYQQGLDDSRSITESAARRARVGVLEKELRDPARAYLAAAHPLAADSAALVEGLIHFYDGRHAEALERARAAAAEFPWLYEAKKLEGDVHLKAGRDAQDGGSYSEALARFEEASAAYAAAANIGRSDAGIHEADCRLHRWTLNIQVEHLHRPVADDRFERAVAACDAALQADPGAVDAPEHKALILDLRVARALSRGEDPRAHLDRAAAVAQQAVAARPDRAFAHATLGVVLLRKARYEVAAGLDPRPTLAAAIKAHAQAARLEPTLTMANQNLGVTHAVQADYELRHGLDPRPSLDAAVAGYRRAAELDPTHSRVWNSIGRAYMMRSEYEIDRGSDAGASIDAAIEALRKASEVLADDPGPHNNLGSALYMKAVAERRQGRDPRALLVPALEAWAKALAINPAYTYTLKNRGEGHLLAAEYELRAGLDPRPAAARALADSSAALTGNPKYAGAHRGIASALAIEARYLVARGNDPSSALARARKALETARALAPGDVETALGSAAVELTAARWETHRGAPPDRALDAAKALLEAAPVANGEVAEIHTKLAEVARIRSERLLADGKSQPAGAEITRGLDAAAKALQINPREAEAIATRGALLLLEARRAADPARKEALERQGRDALADAVRIDPLLARSIGPIPAK